MKITNTRDRQMQYIRCLVHGDSGVGKTTSLKTLPPDKTIILSAERGLLPLRAMQFPVLQIESWGDMRNAMGWLRNPKEAPQEIQGALESCTVIAIDSLSELSAMCQQQIVDVDRRKVLAERHAEKGSDQPQGMYADLMQREDWGVYFKRMMSLINAYNHLPAHIIFTCLSGWITDEHTGRLLRVPGLNGQAAQKCAAAFDLVLYMESQGNGKDNVRIWRTFNDGGTAAKDASGALDAFEPPDWTALFTKILAKGKSK